MTKRLAAFDFDHTIVDDNTDTAVMDLIDKSKIPKKVKDLHKTDGWTAFMQAIFKLLHENGKTRAEIGALIATLPPVDGMVQLLNFLHDRHYDIIIISDCNSFFIDTWLRSNGLEGKVLRVFTNPAHFTDDGLLKITMYHLQEFCRLSTKNLCKGQILEDFLQYQEDEKDVVYERIVYCGDGMNDFCPILRLRQGDLACVRDKYKCVDLVRKAQAGNTVQGELRDLKAEVLVWSSGKDILERLS